MDSEDKPSAETGGQAEALPPKAVRAAAGQGRGLRRPARGAAAEQLRAVVEGLAAIAAPLATSVNDVLSRIASVARDLTGAEFCALGIGVDPRLQFDPWVFAGMTDEQAREIGRSPRPVCLLGAVPQENRTLRLADLHRDRRFCGFPSHHPDMGRFLGVPVRLGERSIGNLYLTNKVGGQAFGVVDQLIVEALATHAAVAVESARLYEEARRRAAELEEERHQRETFISVVSHELRGPITVLMGYADLLRGYERMPVERRERALRALGDETRLMNRLIADLLDTSRIQTDHFALEVAPVDLVELARRAVAAQQTAMPDHPVTLQAPPHLSVAADSARLMQVLSNLLSNAAKYSPEGSAIGIGISAADREAMVSVADRGVGIPPHQLQYLFRPYSRLHREHRVAKGIGLGLFVAKGIVEAQGGRIWAESPGADLGTTFYFTVPLSRRQGHSTG
ncbi:MAG: ATP-binding protein [Chloroflexi bacterium]|nr:ATP-binding protein [Chloroflexota bacterium]MCL5110438.1 ATP-binding protein [Chloroflexota bacterium]